MLKKLQRTTLILFTAIFTLLLALCFASKALAAFQNYNSILMGDRAAGMGGAYTALTGDPAACSFYNPATIAQSVGSALSATATAYQKFDTNYGASPSFASAATRVNQGNFIPIPASAGSVIGFGTFSIALSIVQPDYEAFSGQLVSRDDLKTYLTFQDTSLWVGGNFALNLTPTSSAGVTTYYTARAFQRSFTDQAKYGTQTALTTEQKNFTNNSVVYVLGYYNRLTSNFSLGASVRMPSIEVSGRGYYNRSTLDTRVSNVAVDQGTNDTASETRIPTKFSVGISYEEKKHQTYSFDITYHGQEEYTDMENSLAGDRIKNNPVWNAAIGYEYYIKNWIALRTGAYTNLSSAPTIEDNGMKQQDHVDMWGFSANMSFVTSQYNSFSFGGFYNGGSGDSTQFMGQRVARVGKAQQVFTMLIGTNFSF